MGLVSEQAVAELYNLAMNVDKKEESVSENLEAPPNLNKAEDDYRSAAESTADYAENQESHNKVAKKRHRLLFAGALFIGLVIFILAGYILATKKTQSPAPQVANDKAASTSSTTQISTTTKNYSSPNFYLSFEYPEDWAVVDNGGGIMTATSPVMKLARSSGDDAKGRIVLTFRAKDQKLPEFDSGSATAAKQSIKIAYTKPTQNQRGSTYESFLRYAGNVNTAALSGVYITGDSGYTLGQSIPKVDIQKVDPIISITFTKCSDNTCAGGGGELNIPLSLWENLAFSGPLEQMLKSITIN